MDNHAANFWQDLWTSLTICTHKLSLKYTHLLSLSLSLSIYLSRSSLYLSLTQTNTTALVVCTLEILLSWFHFHSLTSFTLSGITLDHFNPPRKRKRNEKSFLLNNVLLVMRGYLIQWISTFWAPSPGWWQSFSLLSRPLKSKGFCPRFFLQN